MADQLGIGPLVWEAQAVTSSYERTRGLRAPGEHADGFGRRVGTGAKHGFCYFDNTAYRLSLPRAPSASAFFVAASTSATLTPAIVTTHL